MKRTEVRPSLGQQTRAQVIADNKYWHDFGDLFGWKLYGWNLRYSACFYTSTSGERMLDILGRERDDIMRVIDELTRKAGQ